jgi:hypothetical protein
MGIRNLFGPDWKNYFQSDKGYGKDKKNKNTELT